MLDQLTKWAQQTRTNHVTKIKAEMGREEAKKADTNSLTQHESQERKPFQAQWMVGQRL